MHDERVSLDGALRLEAQLESIELRPLSTARVHFSLRNVSSTAVEFCQLDGGVTVAAAGDRGVVPVIGFGSVLHTRCYRRGKLKPGEARVFEDEFVVPHGSSFVTGSIRIHRPGEGSVHIEAVPLALTMLPADTLLQPPAGGAR
jgi:hypothetical protein